MVQITTSKKFVLFCQARSGSTLLRLALHSHPQIICHGEVLSRKWIQGLVPRDDPEKDRSDEATVESLLPFRESDPFGFLDRFVWDFEGYAVGFKLILEDLFKSENKERYKQYFMSSGVTPLILYRRDQLATYVSRVRMARHKIRHLEKGVTGHFSESAPQLAVDPKVLHRFVNGQVQYLRETVEMFTDPVIICYEEMLDSYSDFLQQLGVENFPFQERLTKTSAENLADMVLDYESIRSSGDYMISLP